MRTYPNAGTARPSRFLRNVDALAAGTGRKVRIFQVCADGGIVPTGTRGSSVHLRSLAAALADRGHRVTSFAARMPGDPTSFPVPLHRLDSDSSLTEAARRSGDPDVIYERYSLSCETSLHSVDPVNLPGPQKGGAGLKAARLIGCPYVLEVNAPLTREAKLHRGLEPSSDNIRGEQTLFREADLVVAVSEPLRRYVESVRGTPAGTVVIRNGFDPAFFKAPARPDQNTNLLVFLGDPRPWHGTDILPTLVRTVQELGHPVRLRVIGGGKGATSLLEKAKAERVEDRMHITGPLPHSAATALLADCSIALAPFCPDPFFYFCPLKIIEYMAAGLPTVTTDQGDISSILGDGGVLTAPGDFAGLADAVEQLLKDSDLRSDIGRQARIRAWKSLTWDDAAACLERSVLGLTTAGRPPRPWMPYSR